LMSGIGASRRNATVPLATCDPGPNGMLNDKEARSENFGSIVDILAWHEVAVLAPKDNRLAHDDKASRQDCKSRQASQCRRHRPEQASTALDGFAAARLWCLRSGTDERSRGRCAAISRRSRPSGVTTASC
jgi:hypothetical protein